jgi:hypothetical protein
VPGIEIIAGRTTLFGVDRICFINVTSSQNPFDLIPIPIKPNAAGEPSGQYKQRAL